MKFRVFGYKSDYTLFPSCGFKNMTNVFPIQDKIIMHFSILSLNKMKLSSVIKHVASFVWLCVLVNTARDDTSVST